jgi:hypothetical protein
VLPIVHPLHGRLATRKEQAALARRVPTGASAKPFTESTTAVSGDTAAAP